MARAVLAATIAVAVLGTAPGEARAPARLMVQADEYSLVLSRQSVVRGPALIQFMNRGEDPHDLKLRRTGGTHAISVSETRPGALAQANVSLRTGRYRLWCSLPDHRTRGMRAILRVRRGR
jgi:uncharacterized cupredoxin-like copper-binding protein